jgi:O-antigen ligase
MDAPLAVAVAIRAAGVVVVAGLVAVAVLGPTVRARAAAMAGTLILTPVLLIGQIWDTPQFRPVRDHPAASVAAAVVGLAAVGGAAWVLHRRPALLAPLLVAALPFRIPIQSGGNTANLLVPLYLVVAAGALAHVVPRLRSRRDEPLPRPGALEALLVGLVVLYAVQATYSTDLSKALQNVVFFYVPFALVFALLRDIAWTRRLLLACFGVAVGLAVVFACIGFVEYSARELLFNPKVVNSNQFETYFRVNSLFFDPNIYGRFLALVMGLLAATLIFSPRPRAVLLAAGALAVLWGGLVLTFSQSSFTALLTALAVLAAMRWDPRRVGVLAGAAIALGIVFVVAFPSAVRLDLASSKSVDKATSGRFDLIKGGLELFGDRPVQGWGAGSFAHEFRHQRKSSSEKAVSASHTIPVTVAAEQGVPGLLAYLALLVVAVATLARGARGDPFRAAVLAAFCALLLHTLLYAAFLEDPITWTLLGIGLALARAPASAPAASAREPALAAGRA